MRTSRTIMIAATLVALGVGGVALAIKNDIDERERALKAVRVCTPERWEMRVSSFNMIAVTSYHKTEDECLKVLPSKEKQINGQFAAHCGKRLASC